MNLKPFLITITIVLLQNLSSFSQAERPLLLPVPGQQYTYQIIQRQYVTAGNNEQYTDFVKRKKLKIHYEAKQPDNSNRLYVSVIENIAVKPEHTPVQFTDYRFPYLSDGIYDKRFTNFHQELLTLVVFQYVFNQEKREIKLHNRAEILLQIRDLLYEKGYEKKEADRYTEEFNTTGIPEITTYFQKIFFPADDIAEALKGKDPAFRSKTERMDSLVHVVHETMQKKQGISSIEYAYHDSQRYLYKYSSTRIDSLKWPVLIHNERHDKFFEEEEIQLVSGKPITEDKLFITGTIKNVRNKKVTLWTLREPFGTRLHQATSFIEEDNSFKIETEFMQAGMVYLEFGLGSDEKSKPTLMFYAEPGSRIHIDADGAAFPGHVEFSGDFSSEAGMVHEFRNRYNLFYESFNFNTLSPYNLKLNYNDFHNAITHYDEFIKACKNRINPHVCNFIDTELKSQLMYLAFYYLRLKYQWMNLPFGKPQHPFMEDIDVRILESHVKDYEILLHYNNYGIHSRQLAGEMLEYNYISTRKVSQLRNYGPFGLSYSLAEFRYIGDLSHQVEVAKIILGGHALYSQLADLLLQEKMKASDKPSKEAAYKQNEVDRYLGLMARVINEPEFKGAIEQLMNNHNVWIGKDYVPGVEFMTANGDKVRMADFIGKKPAIFFVTGEWGTERYLFDDLARENPDMNFVLIMEGSNFGEWTNYLSRAEPVAHQLFWKNNNLQLRDIFRNDIRHFIVYDRNGERIGFATDPVAAVNLVRQNLKEKENDSDKSQLVNIIIALLAMLFIFLLVLLVWKWRVRQRFRKEQQHRRLLELELTAIRSQMNPHFLFNCLNSVQNLVQQNKGREAHLYLADFAGLIRKVLNNSEKEEVSLAEELEMVKQYLNLEKLRFDFNFNININEEVDIYNTSLPSMLLQPIAENAVTHGLQYKQNDRHMKIEVLRKAERVNGRHAGKGILISIEDNGVGRLAVQNTETHTNGKATRLIQERLAILQQKTRERYRMRTIDLNGNGATGTRVEIFVPEEN